VNTNGIGYGSNVEYLRLVTLECRYNLTWVVHGWYKECT